jgi:chaperonin GroES
MENSPITPLGDKVVIRPVEEGEEMYGNIIIPDMGKERPEMGVVIAVGPGRITPDGNLVPNKLEVGQQVLVPKFGAQNVDLFNENFIIASENDILGIVNENYTNE